MEKTITLRNFFEKKCFFIPIGLIFFLISCSDSVESDVVNNPSGSYVCSTCKTQPEALPENDNSFKGIYAGIDGADIVYFDIDNKSDGIAKSFVMQDNILKQFSLVNQWSDESRYYYSFKGRISYGHHETPLINLDFSVDYDGKNPAFSFGSGVLAKVQSNYNIVKEKSDELIEVFDGQISQKTVRIVLGNSTGTELTEGKVRGEVTEEVIQIIGTERYVISRSKAYWYSVSSSLSINGEILPSISNQGLIVNDNLIDDNNQNVGKLSRDSFSGKISIEEYGDMDLISKRVL
ncbi:MAG: hypothetical protein V4670_02720 [Bacteroidota bacterium]